MNPSITPGVRLFRVPQSPSIRAPWQLLDLLDEFVSACGESRKLLPHTKHDLVSWQTPVSLPDKQHHEFTVLARKLPPQTKHDLARSQTLVRFLKSFNT